MSQPSDPFAPPPEGAAAAPTAPPAALGGSSAVAAYLPSGTYLDPVSGLTLPQGVALASVGRRIGAYLLAIPLAVVTLGIGYVVWGLVAWSRGQTPALQVLGMRCWRPETGRVPTWGWMALREVVGRIVEGILSFVTLLVSFVLFLATKEHRSLHDMVAGTVVLHDPTKLLDPRSVPPAGPAGALAAGDAHA